MAIIGTGIDIVEISRISGIISSYGDKFLNRVYTPAEVALCAGVAHGAARFAGRFAAKEAFYKALPASVQPNSSWKSIQILVDDSGRPYIEICDGRLRGSLISDVRMTSIHVSISHERAYCVAVVIFEGDR